MAKQRGYPDQRGLWAESDSIAEQFVPSEKMKPLAAIRRKKICEPEFRTRLVAPKPL